VIVVSLWRETKNEDTRRTSALLDAVDTAFADDQATPIEDGSFRAVVVDGLGCGEHCTDYPPAGHTYPRRG
jgi:hypothetical protein